MQQAYGDNREPRNGNLFLFNYGRPPLNRQRRPPESLFRLYLYYILQPPVFLQLAFKETIDVAGALEVEAGLRVAEFLE